MEYALKEMYTVVIQHYEIAETHLVNRVHFLALEHFPYFIREFFFYKNVSSAKVTTELYTSILFLIIIFIILFQTRYYIYSFAIGIFFLHSLYFEL